LSHSRYTELHPDTPENRRAYSAGCRGRHQGVYGGDLGAAEARYARRGANSTVYADGWIDYLAHDSGGPETLEAALAMRFSTGFSGNAEDYDPSSAV